jgi:hypothetical protein
VTIISIFINIFILQFTKINRILDGGGNEDTGGKTRLGRLLCRG